MCGITGYIGREKQTKDIIKMLKKLEYRGYDSAGYAGFQNGKFLSQKSVGNIDKLLNKVPENEVVNLMISHTRWATNGASNEINAHPHISSRNKWAVVHNGIIENCEELKSKFNLKTKGETDTEVFCELLDKLNIKNIDEFIAAANILEGSFAIAAICEDKPNTMFLAKEKSPLYVAECGGDFIVASDPICFDGFSKNCYGLNDGEFAEICGGKIVFYNRQKMVVSKQAVQMGCEYESANKQNFPHFMLKEIMEEKAAILNQISVYESTKVLERFDDKFLNQFDDIKFIGCGTAYHAGLMAAKFVNKILNKPASAEIASEFIYNEPNFINSKTLYFFISQSGETADTIEAMKLVKKSTAVSVALTNVLYSTVSKLANFVLPVAAAVEIAVASTKAYVCMLSATYLFCNYFLGKNKFEIAKTKLRTVAQKILNFNTEQIDSIAAKLKDKNMAVFIGKDMDYISAKEAALKLKEVSYINATAYPSGELKHGFLAMVENGTPLFVFLNQNKILSKTLSSKNEAESRGAKSIIYSNKSIDGEVIFVDEEDEILSQILVASQAQYLAYRVSILKNINPDQPRNLAKSVTVEWTLFLFDKPDFLWNGFNWLGSISPKTA